MKICAHTIFKNEERYLWYSVMSVIEHVDRVLLWDTGSSDNSYEIAQLIKDRYPEKVDLRQIGDVTAEGYTKTRQKMLDETDEDWFIIVDADEVWWEDTIKELVINIKEFGSEPDSFVSGYYNLVGDPFHYIPESAGRYKIDNRQGHLTIRAMNRRIPGLYTSKPHGQHGYFDQNDIAVQDIDANKRKHIETKAYLHFTHLMRSSSLENDKKVTKRGFKYKYELGKAFPLNFYYPEVFFYKKPDLVRSIWYRRSPDYVNRSSLYIIPRAIKSILPRKEGY